MTMPKLSLSLAALAAAFVLINPIAAQAETTGPDPEAHVYIISPAPNAYFPDAPVSIDVEVAVSQGEFQIVDTVELVIDDVPFATTECFTGCVFVGIELGQGVHELRAVGNTGTQTTTLVYVVDEPPPEPNDTGDTTDSEGDTTDSDTGGESAGESGGESAGDTAGSDDELGDDTGSGASNDDMPSSGCEVDSKPSPWGLLALPVLLLIPAIRRRD